MRFRLILFVFLLPACQGIFSTPIQEILDHPRRYDGKTVTIEGEVQSSANVLLLRFYKVKDKTGEITVTTNHAVPRRGAKVRVSGVVRQAFVLGDENLTVLSEESAAEP